MSDLPERLHRSLRNQPEETIMTGGSLLYLLMCLATFGGFSAALAYASWLQDRQDHETVPTPAGAPRESGSITA
jgi:hypothetical protein